MRLLFDTHLLVWAAGRLPRLPSAARDLLNDPETIPVFSVATIWEIAIKHGLRRADFVVDPHVMRRAMLDAEYQELPITAAHALAVTTLPPLHRDPFDRILVAQAIVEGVLLLTVDPMLARYPAPVRLM